LLYSAIKANGLFGVAAAMETVKSRVERTQLCIATTTSHKLKGERSSFPCA